MTFRVSNYVFSCKHVNAFLSKALDVPTSNFAGAYRSPDVDGIGQHFV